MLDGVDEGEGVLLGVWLGVEDTVDDGVDEDVWLGVEDGLGVLETVLDGVLLGV